MSPLRHSMMTQSKLATQPALYLSHHSVWNLCRALITTWHHPVFLFVFCLIPSPGIFAPCLSCLPLEQYMVHTWCIAGPPQTCVEWINELLCELKTYSFFSPFCLLITKGMNYFSCVSLACSFFSMPSVWHSFSFAIEWVPLGILPLFSKLLLCKTLVNMPLIKLLLIEVTNSTIG